MALVFLGLDAWANTNFFKKQCFCFQLASCLSFKGQKLYQYHSIGGYLFKYGDEKIRKISEYHLKHANIARN
jgi:hypothetical protein